MLGSRHDPCTRGPKSTLLIEKSSKKTEGGRDGDSLMDGRGIYVGESSRSIYERAREHVADREKQHEDSHQVKHWLTSHEELLAPPAFKFKIVKTFQDPLTRQLAEAVRIELRGEGILNSKAEFSRCRVPRLRIDMEGWKEKVEKKLQTEVKGLATTTTSQQEENQMLARLLEEAEIEESLAEVDLKRKADEPTGQEGRKPKKRRLVGWGVSDSQGEADQAEQCHILPGGADWTLPWQSL